MWQMFQTRVAKPEGISCISFSRKGIAYARMMPRADHSEIQACDFLPCLIEGEQEKTLKEYITFHKLENSDCIYVLQPNEYRLITIDAPNVSPAELKESARWAVMDFVDFPFEEAAIDTFRVPGPEGQKHKLFVVITRKSLLKRIEKVIYQSGLRLFRIDIAELALCNIIPQLYDDSGGIALLLSGYSGEHLIVEKEKLLFYKRSFERFQKDDSATEQSVSEFAMASELETDTDTESAKAPQAGFQTESTSAQKERTAASSYDTVSLNAQPLSEGDDVEEYLVVEVDDKEDSELEHLDKVSEEMPDEKVEQASTVEPEVSVSKDVAADEPKKDAAESEASGDNWLGQEDESESSSSEKLDVKKDVAEPEPEPETEPEPEPAPEPEPKPET